MTASTAENERAIKFFCRMVLTAILLAGWPVVVLNPASADEVSITPAKIFASGLGDDITFIEELSLSADGSVLAVGVKGAFQIWDLPNGKLLREGKMNGPPLSGSRFAMSPDGKKLALLNSMGMLVIQSAATGDVENELAPFRSLRGLGFQGTATFFAAGSTDDQGTQRVVRWETAGWEEKDSQSLPANAWSIDFSHDGSLIGIGTNEGALSYLDVKTGKSVVLIEDGTFELDAIVFSGDGKWLAAKPYEQNVLVFAIGKKPGKLTLARTDTVCPDMIFFHDQRGLLVAGGINDLQIWDVQNGNRRGKLTGLQEGFEKNNRFQKMAATPDGKRVVAADNFGMIYIWDASKLAGRAVRQKNK